MKTKHLLIIFFSLLFVNVVYGASLNNNCDIATSCGPGEVPIFSVSSATNAHAAQDPSYYSNKVCCSVSGYQTFGNSCDSGLFTLSDLVNAHVSVNDYSNKICLVSSGSNGVNCVVEQGSCSNGRRCVVSVSSATNAHVADCNDNTYTNKLCCGGGITPPAGIVGIRVVPSTATMMVGDRLVIHVYEIYNDGHESDVKDISQVTFTASGGVSVNNFGLVTANSVDSSAKVTADYFGLTDDLNINVVPPGPPVVSYCLTTPNPATVEIGKTQDFAMQVYYTARKDPEDDQPGDAGSYRSSDASVATIVDTGVAGVATGIKVGTTNIDGRFNGKQCEYSKLGVIPSGGTTELSYITIDPENAKANIGVTENYIVEAYYTDEKHKIVTDSASYQVNELVGINVVQNLGKGSFKCLSLGKVQIIAKYTEDEKTVSKDATLECVPIGSKIYSNLELVPKNPEASKGSLLQFNAYAYYSDGSKEDVTNLAKYSSTTVIGLGTVLTPQSSLDGKFTANEIGIAIVSVKYTNLNIQKHDKTKVNVVNSGERIPSYVRLDPEDPKIKLGLQRKFSLTLVYSDGSSEDVTSQATWNVKDIFAVISTPVATSLGNGLFRGDNLGTAEVIGRYTKNGIEFYDKSYLYVTNNIELSHITLQPVTTIIPLDGTVPYEVRRFLSTDDADSIGTLVTSESTFIEQDIIAVDSGVPGLVATSIGQGVYQGTKIGSALITARHTFNGITKKAVANLYVGRPTTSCQITKVYWSRNPEDVNDEFARVITDQSTPIYVNIETENCNYGNIITFTYTQTPPGSAINDLSKFDFIRSTNLDIYGKGYKKWDNPYFYDTGLGELIYDTAFEQPPGPDYLFTATYDDGIGYVTTKDSSNKATVQKGTSTPIGCNNGIVDEDLGEECDPPGTTDGTKTCNNRCKWQEENPPPEECTGSNCSPGSGSSECSQQSYTKTYGGTSGSYNGVCGVIDQCYNGERFSGRYSDCRSNQVCCKGVKGDSGTIRVNENGACKPNPAKPGSAEGIMTQKICTINTQTNQKTCNPAQQVKCRLPLSGIKVSFFTLTNLLIVIGLIVIFYIVKSVSKKKVVKEVKKKRRKKRL